MKPSDRIDSRRRRRFSRDTAVLALYDCCIALERLDHRMQLVTLEFLYDKYVRNWKERAADEAPNHE